MKISTLFYMVFIVILLSFYFFVIDPLIGPDRWVGWLFYFVMFTGLMLTMEKLEARFEFLRKKVDGQMCAWFVAALLFMPFFLSMVI